MFQLRRSTAGLLAATLCWVASVVAQTTQFTGRVVAIIDGDTVGVMRDGREVRVRLDGIDAPETGQDYSQRAKQFTSDLAFGQTANVDVKDIDRYGRLVARVVVGGRDVSVALAQAGLAWHFLRYSKDQQLQAAEDGARALKLGLWSMPNPTPPWEYRDRREASVPGPPERLGGVVPLSPFLGNTRSSVVHASNCPSLKSCQYCTRQFATVAAAAGAGYRPHSGPDGCIKP